MDKSVIWNSGIDNFIEKKLVIDNNNRFFTFTLNETEFEPNREIFDIFYDHLKNRGTKTVEILYSGGVDSELALLSCIKNKIPCVAITMVIRVKGAIINVRDLYYSEKFCTNHQVTQKKYVLDVENMFFNDRYKEYLEPYNIYFPHVAAHFWLLEQCNSYPVMGGDWPWVQEFANPKVISPQRLEHNCYEKFMSDKGIDGIGSMFSHSFESCYRLMQLQMKHAEDLEQGMYSSSFLKQKMYKVLEPRIRHYCWEDCPKSIFNEVEYRNILKSRYRLIDNTIVWNSKIGELLDTPLRQNNKH
jgi:hypothetical protein